MVIGLGVSHKVTVENWFDAEITKPVTQMREYAGIVKAILRGEPAPDGEFFNTNFAFMGYPPRPELPVYIAALSPNMLQLAGEIGDGVMLWLCSPDYIRDVVVPRSPRAARRRARPRRLRHRRRGAGRLTEDRDAVLETMRGDLVTYMSLPFYRAMLERSGFGEEIAAFDEGMGAGDVEKAKAGISGRMLTALTGVGSADDVRAGIERYRDAGAVSPSSARSRGPTSRRPSRPPPNCCSELALRRLRERLGLIADDVGEVAERDVRVDEV